VSQIIQDEVVGVLHQENPILDSDVIDNLTTIFRCPLPHWLHSPYELKRKIGRLIRIIPVTPHTTVPLLPVWQIERASHRFHRLMLRALHRGVAEQRLLIQNREIPYFEYVWARSLEMLSAAGSVTLIPRYEAQPETRLREQVFPAFIRVAIEQIGKAV
jgi:hypothetical protein